jgi:hypothetical protein
MGATHFLMKTLPRVASEMALHVLAYNLTRVMNIMGIGPLMAAIGHSQHLTDARPLCQLAGRFHTTKTHLRHSREEGECLLVARRFALRYGKIRQQSRRDC